MPEDRLTLEELQELETISDECIFLNGRCAKNVHSAVRELIALRESKYPFAVVHDDLAVKYARLRKAADNYMVFSGCAPGMTVKKWQDAYKELDAALAEGAE